MTNEEPIRLQRSRDRKIAGVAGGVAEYLELDPTLVRLGFAVLALLAMGGVAVAYVVMWLVIPAPADEGGRDVEAARPAAPPSKLVFAVIAVLLVLALGGGIAWLGALSVQLLRISVPIWIIVIVGAYLLMRSRPTRTS